MDKQKIPTKIGVIVLIIMAITAAIYVYYLGKDEWKEIGEIGQISYNAANNNSLRSNAKLLDSGDDMCQKDEDCINVMMECSCDCGMEVNKTHKEKYDKAWLEKCRDFSSEVKCQMDCYSRPVCLQGKCVNAGQFGAFSENVVGGDRDEHGCIGSAGYTWCEEKQKCLRSWEESCS